MPSLQYKVIDGHAHVGSTRYIPPSFLMGVASNMERALPEPAPRNARDKLYDVLVGTLQDHDATRLLAEMDAGDIEKTVLLLPDFTFALKDSECTVEEMFSDHARLLERHPDRFSVLAGVDPRWGDDGIALFEKGICEYGFSGLKLYPPCGYRANDRSLYPFYEICSRDRLPVILHTGGTSPALSFEEARPIFIDQPARDFPNVNFILAHGAVTYVEESVMLCTHRPNVYLDMSGSAAHPLEKLRAVARAPILHKLIYGSDWPVFNGKSTPREEIDRLLGNDSPLGTLSPTAIRRIFRNTIQNLLGDNSVQTPAA